MKKVIKVLLICIGVFLVIFICANLLPSKETKPLYTTADFNLQGNLTSENGYFIFLGMYEPENIDLKSNEIIQQYIEAEVKCNRNVMEKIFQRLVFRQKNNKPYKPFYDIVYEINFDKIIKDRDEIKKRARLNKFLLDRYEKVINSKIFEYIGPGPQYEKHRTGVYLYIKDTPIPLSSGIPSLYIANTILDGIENGWISVADKLLKYIELGQKTSRSALSGDSLFDGMMKSSKGIEIWAQILNSSAYAPVLYDLTLTRLEKYRGFNDRLKFQIMDLYLWFFGGFKNRRPEMPRTLDSGIIKYPNAVLYSFTYNKNRTLSEYNDYFKKVMDTINIPPYKRTEKVKTVRETNPFWWFVNFGGRIYLDEEMPDPYYYIDWYYLKQAQIDLILILAMLHQNKIPYEQVQPFLDNLVNDNYIDPFTGKAFIWDEKTKSVRTVEVKEYKWKKRFESINYIAKN